MPDIASRVSTHREAVTKEIGVLLKNGVTKRTRGVLRVIDVKHLEVMVHERSKCLKRHKPRFSGRFR